jgi:transketolase
MRTEFIQELIAQARENPQIFLVVGDLGYSVVEPFATEFPERFLNAGVAEQNMTGVAAGLASEGYHVFTYSIANFPTLRCLEQIRNDICYHGYNVTITAVGSGLAYGNLGFSHHGIQDLAIMRALPHIKILSPCDPGEVRACVRYLAENPGPSYLRIGKSGEPDLHAFTQMTEAPILVQSGNEKLALVATGPIVKLAMEVASRMELHARPSVFSLPLIKPFSKDALTTLASFKKIIVLEENVVEGGLFAALAENLPCGLELRQCALLNDSASLAGSQNWLRRKSGMIERLEAILKSVAKR